jgi:hypothetical protein
MKKLLLTLGLLACALTLSAQKRAVAELFINNNSGDYDSIVSILDKEGIDFCVNHYRDELENPGVLKRLNHLNEWNIPSVYVNGLKVANNKLLNPTTYSGIKNRTGDYTGQPYVSTSITRIDYVVPPINILTLKMKIPEPDEFRITAMITEDIGEYRNTMRVLMIEDSLWEGEEIQKSVQCPGLNLQNCKILILLENSEHQVVGCYHQPLIISGIEEFRTEFKVYPNPSDSQITVESATPIGLIWVYNLTGKMVYTEKVESTNLRLNLEPGMYVLKVKGETRKVIVK